MSSVRPNSAALAGQLAAVLGLALSLPFAAVAATPMQTVTVEDLNGFGRPIPAATVQIPAGWRAQGGIRWDRSTDCVANQMRFNWLATAADGRSAYEIMPGLSWQLAGTETEFNACPAVSLNSARAFLERVVQQRHPGARMIQFRDRPDLAQQLTAGPQANPNARARVEGGQVLIGYRDGNIEMREVLTATVSFSEFQGNVVGGTATVSALRAPEGKLDFALSDQINGSMKADRQWVPMMMQATRQALEQISQKQQNAIAIWHNGRMGDINRRGAADRAALSLQSNREVAQIYSNVWKNGQATDERILRRSLEAVGEYDTYADPANNSNVRNSIHNGPRVFSHGNDAYSSTDDPYAQPSDATELERLP